MSDLYNCNKLEKMLEYVFLTIMCLIVVTYCRNHPVVKHYVANSKERTELAKRHARLFKARNNLMVRFLVLMSSLDAF